MNAVGELERLDGEPAMGRKRGGGRDQRDKGEADRREKQNVGDGDGHGALR
ncbi:MAG: hypothetical protein H6873_05480 [Hyphomicrobiaceae bacterium]|nr:hypothetical protein [Hyphomicrobiaceae bacterium]